VHAAAGVPKPGGVAQGLEEGQRRVRKGFGQRVRKGAKSRERVRKGLEKGQKMVKGLEKVRGLKR